MVICSTYWATPNTVTVSGTFKVLALKGSSGASSGAINEMIIKPTTPELAFGSAKTLRLYIII